MQQSGKGVKRTLGQKTEDRLMKYILDKPVKIGERIPTEGELTELFEVGRCSTKCAKPNSSSFSSRVPAFTAKPQ